MGFPRSKYLKLTHNGQRHNSLLAMMKKLTPTLAAKSSNPRETQSLQVFEEKQRLRNDSGFTKVFLGSTVYEIQLSFGSFYVRISSHVNKPKDSLSNVTDLIRRKRQQQITVSFVPSCFVSSIFELTLSRGHCPQMSLKCFNLRPGWSPIFKYCDQGELYKVQELIEDGLASPNDVDEDGWTPLHVSSFL